MLYCREVLDDFRLAKQQFPNDEALSIVSEALQLSQSAIFYDKKLLPVQMIGRIQNSEVRKLYSFVNIIIITAYFEH